MGLRSGTEWNLPLCLCQESVEDELHFLTRCALYDKIRQQHGVTRETKLCDILNEPKYMEYIDQLYKHRSSLRGSWSWKWWWLLDGWIAESDWVNVSCWVLNNCFRCLHDPCLKYFVATTELNIFWISGLTLINVIDVLSDFCVF